jgi:hypothetical protein
MPLSPPRLRSNNKLLLLRRTNAVLLLTNNSAESIVVASNGFYFVLGRDSVLPNILQMPSSTAFVLKKGTVSWHFLDLSAGLPTPS